MRKIWVLLFSILFLVSCAAMPKDEEIPENEQKPLNAQECYSAYFPGVQLPEAKSGDNESYEKDLFVSARYKLFAGTEPSSEDGNVILFEEPEDKADAVEGQDPFELQVTYYTTMPDSGEGFRLNIRKEQPGKTVYPDGGEGFSYVNDKKGYGATGMLYDDCVIFRIAVSEANVYYYKLTVFDADGNSIADTDALIELMAQVHPGYRAPTYYDMTPGWRISNESGNFGELVLTEYGLPADNVIYEYEGDEGNVCTDLGFDISIPEQFRHMLTVYADGNTVYMRAELSDGSDPQVLCLRAEPSRLVSDGHTKLYAEYEDRRYFYGNVGEDMLKYRFWSEGAGEDGTTYEDLAAPYADSGLSDDVLWDMIIFDHTVLWNEQP